LTLGGVFFTPSFSLIKEIALEIRGEEHLGQQQERYTKISFLWEGGGFGGISKQENRRTINAINATLVFCAQFGLHADNTRMVTYS
jgi:hypothetical protein